MPRKHSESRQRTVLIALRLLPEERAVLEAAARARKISSLSEFIRASALAAAKEKP
jgi:uncharacterized protein (DUF1778 family)